MDKKLKEKIDNMSQLELCRAWRFASVGDPMFQGEVGKYFSKVLKERGGFTSKISKQLEWG